MTPLNDTIAALEDKSASAANAGDTADVEDHESTVTRPPSATKHGGKHNQHKSATTMTATSSDANDEVDREPPPKHEHSEKKANHNGHSAADHHDADDDERCDTIKTGGLLDVGISAECARREKEKERKEKHAEQGKKAKNVVDNKDNDEADIDADEVDRDRRNSLKTASRAGSTSGLSVFSEMFLNNEEK